MPPLRHTNAYLFDTFRWMCLLITQYICFFLYYPRKVFSFTHTSLTIHISCYPCYPHLTYQPSATSQWLTSHQRPRSDLPAIPDLAVTYQPSVASQWASRKTMTSPEAARAPTSLALIRPDRSLVLTIFTTPSDQVFSTYCRNFSPSSSEWYQGWYNTSIP